MAKTANGGDATSATVWGWESIDDEVAFVMPSATQLREAVVHIKAAPKPPVAAAVELRRPWSFDGGVLTADRAQHSHVRQRRVHIFLNLTASERGCIPAPATT